MVIEIGLLSLAMIATSIIFSGRHQSDKRKIERIFEAAKLNSLDQFPKFIKKPNPTTYMYSLPIGLTHEKIKKKLNVFQNGLNKNVTLDFKNGFLFVNVYESDLPTKFNYDYKELFEDESTNRKDVQRNNLP